MEYSYRGKVETLDVKYNLTPLKQLHQQSIRRVNSELVSPLITTFLGMSVWMAWIVSRTTGGESVRQMGSTEPLISMAKEFGGPVMDICMLKGRRT